MTVRNFTPPHGYLILRQQGKRVGIWHLKDDCWYRRPFTESVSMAYAALRATRGTATGRPELPRNKSHPLLWLTLIGVWGWWLMGWVG